MAEIAELNGKIIKIEENERKIIDLKQMSDIEQVVDFFREYGLDVGSNKIWNNVGNTGIVRYDIQRSGIANETHSFSDMVWGSVTEEQLKHTLWWICLNKDKGIIYIFELPEKKHFKRNDFIMTYKTKRCNEGYGYNKNTRKYDKLIGKPKDEKYKQADIILDMTDECFIEVLGSIHNNFAEYLRAKLDINKKELFVYSDNIISEEEYKKRREEYKDKLSDEQKKAATTDAKEALIIAGAGCGKTHTLMGRVIHLYETGKIKDSDKLLWVVFNNKNRSEHESKLSEKGYSVSSSQTFHSLGLKILRAAGINKTSVDPEADPLNSVVELYIKNFYEDDTNNKYNKTLKNLFEKIQEQKENWIANLRKWAKLSVQFENSDIYSDFVSDTEQREYVTMLEQLNTSLDTINYRYFDDDKCKLRMLNYLFLNGYTHNDIDVDHKSKCIEVTCGNNKKFCWDKYELCDIFEQMKKNFGKKGNITKRELGEKINDAILRSRSDVFMKTAKLFINLCKIYQETNLDKIKEEVARETSCPDRIYTFFELIKPIYNTYEEFLRLEGIIDFNDMINEAINVLNKELKDDKSKFQYDYILVDEYQDIAQDTFNLIKALKERSNASIMCVGDDWQSIYSWKGSDLKFFNKFSENFEITSFQEFKVTQTYRYGQNLANISSKFITQNKNQKNKKISSNEQKTKIIPYRSENGWQNLLNTIQKDYGTDKTIKVLLRYNNDFKIIGKNTIEELRNELRQQFTNKDNDVVTIHRAKGLEADIIIILNMIKGKFPSEKVSDPVLQYFSKYRSDDDYPYAEERRLFYVAMTRAKKACYLYLPPEGQESSFWDEIKDDPNIEH